MKINLHTHSNYSLDGNYSPNNLIEILKNNNFDIVSITDHNTCEAYRHISNNSSIKIITGIEADAIVENHVYDFLCYDFDIEEIYKYTSNRYQTVEKRQRKIFDELVKKCKYNNIRLANTESYNETKEYAHEAVFRMIDKDFLIKYSITNVNDFYRISTINKDFPLFIDMHIILPEISELIEIIHKNNGKVFIAHPYRYNKKVKEVLNDVVKYVDGIEICNNPNNKEEVELLYSFAKENNKLVSCGSDFHGNSRYGLECEYLTEDMIESVLSWIKF